METLVGEYYGYTMKWVENPDIAYPQQYARKGAKATIELQGKVS